jgi:acetyl coenzyme A synthetase (ADP forming)-like protein
MGELETLFAPDRVAVVGASDEEGSVGHAVTRNLLDTFDGEVLAVNPNRETVLGLACYDDVGETDADLAVVVVPATVAVGVVRSAAAAGIDNVVVITAGFSEAGEAGRERELRDIAGEHDLNLVGPNSLGIMSTAVDMNATFGPRDADPGTISFMSQSGAFVTAVLDWAADRDVGFRHVVSLGNKAVLDEGDFVREWGDDPETEVVLGYLEDVADGRAFVETAREVTAETPVVVVKSGRTEAGASAAASHTGAIAGSEAAYRAGLEQAGVLRADSVQELFDYASMLAGQPLPGTDGVAVVTNAGGPGVMTTDAIGAADLDLATLGDATRERLAETLPAAANVYNPVDIIGDAPVERFAETLDIVLADDNVGMAVVLSCPSATLSFDALADEVVRSQARHGVPVAATLMGGSSTESAAATLAAAGIPTYFDPARAVDALGALARYADIREREYTPPGQFDVDRERARAILTDAAGRGRTRLGVEAMDLLAAYGIPTPEGAVVDSPGEARSVAERIGGNVVMKIVSPDISHKSDIGGVEVGVPPGAVASTYEDLVVRARNYQPDATILGVQVQELVDTGDGTETIVGVTRDPQFGPLVMVGLGGIFVEVMEDTAFRVAPVSEPEVREMFEALDSMPLLYGARGREPADIDALVETIQRVSQLVTDFPAITELDINPAVALPDGVAAVDLRLTLDPDALDRVEGGGTAAGADTPDQAAHHQEGQ